MADLNETIECVPKITFIFRKKSLSDEILFTISEVLEKKTHFTEILLNTNQPQRHVHEEHGSDRRLPLTIALFWMQDRPRFEQIEQVFFSEEETPHLFY